MTNPIDLLLWTLAGNWWFAVIFVLAFGALLALAVFTGGW